LFDSADYIYSIFLSGSYYKTGLLEAFYKQNQQRFLKYLDFLLHEDFKKNVMDVIQVPYIPPKYTTTELFDTFRELSQFYYESLNDKGRNFLNARGITDSEISTYCIGSTEGILTKQFDDFIMRLSYKRTPKELLVKLLETHDLLMTVVYKLYQNEHFVTIPSFDSNGVCNGICLRAIGHRSLNKKKNLYKFHFFNAPAFLFGENYLPEYASVYVVEGVFDVIALHRAGIHNVVCLGNVTMSPWQYEKIKDKDLTFIMDNDLGGIEGIARFQRTLWPSHEKDSRFFLLPDKRDFDEMSDTDINTFLNQLDVREEVIC